MLQKNSSRNVINFCICLPATDTDPLRVSQKLIFSDMTKFVVDGVEDMEDFLLGTLGKLTINTSHIL